MDVHALLGETAWLRRLARSLVGDPDAADDLVQDAVLIAREKAPADRPLRPWLSRVVINLVRMRARSDRRRAARELRANEGGATPDELFARVEMQRMLAEVVLALDPPDRDVVLLHFVEDLSSTEIGKRLGIADATVRWRLKTALVELRARLDERSGGKRAAWAAPLATFAAPTRPLLAFTGALAMKKLLVALAIVIAVAILWLATRDRGDTGRTAHDLAPAAAARATRHAAARDALVPAWFAQPGVVARRIAGRVVAGDKALANARVELSVIGLDDRRRTITTGADGAFDFGVVPPASYRIGATAAQQAPATKRIDLANPAIDSEHVLLDLGPCTSMIAGTASDSNGGPIARAQILVDGAVVGESDVHGHYELCVPPESTLQIEADGYATFTTRNRVYGRLSHDVALPIEGTITGTITAAGEPVAAARVAAVQMSGRPHTVGRTTLSAGDGTFQIGGLGSGMFRLVVDARDLSGATDAIAVEPGVATRQDVALSPSAGIHGRVVMAGQPVAGVRVHVETVAAAQSTRVYTQRDGTFAIPSPPPGRLAFVTWPHELVSPSVVERGAKAVVLEVKPTTTIRGRVLQDGAPVRDAYVTCDPVKGPTRAERDGTFELAGLRGRSCMLAGYATTRSGMSERVPIELVPGTLTADVILSSTALIEGTVVDEIGAPVPNVFVRLAGEGDDNGEAITDAAGRFRAESLIGRMPYHPSVFPTPSAGRPFRPASGAPFDAVQVPEPDTHVTGVRLAIRARRESIRGRIVDHDGRPVADAWVFATGETNGPLAPPSADTDRDGRFEIGNLASGRYFLLIEAIDGASAARAGVATGSDITVELPRGGRVEGSLVGFRGPVAVSAHAPAPGQSWTWWDDDGRYQSLGLAPGDYFVSAHGGGSDVERVTVRPGETTRVDLVARGTARVEATLVLHRTRTPIANAPCVATAVAQGVHGVHALFEPEQLDATTDATGRVVLHDAPAGRVRVLCFPQGSSAGGAEVEVATGGVASIEVVAAPIVEVPVAQGFTVSPYVMPSEVGLVNPDRAAAKAGLRPGDQIAKLDGEDVANLYGPTVERLVRNRGPGKRVSFVVRRGDALVPISFVLEKP